MDYEELKKLIRENAAKQLEVQRKVAAGVTALAVEKPDRWTQEQADKAELDLLRFELANLLDGTGDRLVLEIADRQSVIAHRATVEVFFGRQADATERWATALERIATALEKAAEAT
jgi:hypothetical protein